MKITIWIHKSEAISGNITNYAFTRPYHDRNEEWVEVQITQDEFARLEDKEPIEDENLFKDEEAMIHERNPDTGEIRSREIMGHNPRYYDVTRNMNSEQIDEAQKRGLIIPPVPAGDFEAWFEGLSPIEKNNYKLSIQNNR